MRPNSSFEPAGSLASHGLSALQVLAVMGRQGAPEILDFRTYTAIHAAAKDSLPLEYQRAITRAHGTMTNSFFAETLQSLEESRLISVTERTEPVENTGQHTKKFIKHYEGNTQELGKPKSVTLTETGRIASEIMRTFIKQVRDKNYKQTAKYTTPPPEQISSQGITKFLTLARATALQESSRPFSAYIITTDLNSIASCMIGVNRTIAGQTHEKVSKALETLQLYHLITLSEDGLKVTDQGLELNSAMLHYMHALRGIEVGA